MGATKTGTKIETKMGATKIGMKIETKMGTADQGEVHLSP
jgi:hypothetical protein